jgi:hypothetical protein
MKHKKFYKLGTLAALFRSRHHWVIVLGNLYIELPNRSQLRGLLLHTLFNIRTEIDCDGRSVTYTDRITKGRLYTFYAWNFRSTAGQVVTILGRDVK